MFTGLLFIVEQQLARKFSQKIKEGQIFRETKAKEEKSVHSQIFNFSKFRSKSFFSYVESIFI